MTRYRVPIKIEFDGEVCVEAKDKFEAEEIAVMQMNGYGVNLSSHGHPAILGWTVDDYGIVYWKDTESIEEIEDE